MAPDESTTRVDLGPTGRAVADNVKRLRTELGLSLREVATRLQENGHPVAHSGLSKIENKTRRVDTDDLVALAAVLGVSPVALLLPFTPDPRQRVDLAGWGSESALVAWKWAVADSALGDAEPVTPSRSLPWWLRVEARFVLEELPTVSRDREIALRTGPRSDYYTEGADDGFDQATP